jgi:hypothetical protein
MALVETTVCRKLEGMYGSRAELARRARVTGSEVLIFALVDHPEACCCYVWEEEGRVRTALAEDPACEAVRAAIDAHHRTNGAG